MPSVIVTGDFMRTGGMDMANLALAEYLAQDDHVHVVGHRVAPDLQARTNVHYHWVPKPMNSYLFAAPFLDRYGRRWASQISTYGGRVFANGGSCSWEDVNWVHYVHAAYRPRVQGGALRKLKARCSHEVFLMYERKALMRARLLITNSKSTKAKLVEHFGIGSDRIHTVYYGTDPNRFRPATNDERAVTRTALGWPHERPVLVFTGALGDCRKGFDILFHSWRELCSRRDWDGHLVVIGTGSELPVWRRRAVKEGLSNRIDFLGFRHNVHEILPAADGLVSPARYEPYGLNVHEALCCGLPALVTHTAGVAEKYPSTLNDLLLCDPPCSEQLTNKLLKWREHLVMYRLAASALSSCLRRRTWSDMASDVIQIVGSN